MGWYDSSWLKRKKITIDAEQVGADHTNFPVLVEFTDLGFAGDAAEDVLFTSSDGTTKLAHTLAVRSGVNDDAVWFWFGEPRSISTAAYTLFGFTRLNGDACVGQLVHATGAWSEFTLSAALQADDHLSPVIAVLPNGFILVVYIVHNDTQLRARMSSAANSIAAFGTEFAVDSGSTSFDYVSVYVRESDGKVFVYYMKDPVALGDRTLHVTSISLADLIAGEEWSTPVALFAVADERPYPKVTWDGEDAHIFMTDGHPQEVTNNSIYYFRHDTSADKFFKADGTEISAASLPFGGSDCDTVYNSVTSTFKAWQSDARCDADGNPAIAFYEYREAGSGTGQDQRLRWAKWNGSDAWITSEIAACGRSISSNNAEVVWYCGGAAIADGAAKVYASVVRDGFRSIYKFTTDDGGATWDAGTLVSEQGFQCYRPTCPRGATADLDVAWLCGSYYYYTANYRTGLVVHPRVNKKSRILAKVKVPALSSAADTDIYVYYDNAEASDQSDAANAKALDTLLDGVGSFVTVALGAPNLAGLTALSLECSFEIDDAPSGVTYLMSSWTSSTNARAMLRIDGGASGDPIESAIQLTTGQIGPSEFVGTSVTPDQKVYAATYYDSTDLRGSVDGVEAGDPVTGTAAMHATASPAMIGGGTVHAIATSGLNGYMEWFDIANSARSGDWRTTRAANIANDGFLVFGDVETESSAGSGAGGGVSTLRLIRSRREGRRGMARA